MYSGKVTFVPHSPAGPGRPRDPDIDRAVLDSTRHHLAQHGYDAMSVIAVAADAGTSRQAIYRRWPTKADLATAAIAGMSQAHQRPDTDDPFADLVDELAAFGRGVARPNGISMVGSMLQAGTDPELRSLFRDRIVIPRRRRLMHILQRASTAGLIDDDANLEIAVAACTGTFYATYLANSAIPADWHLQTAMLVWRAVGGQPS
jgi:AcrR family transcriptional regulator